MNDTMNSNRTTRRSTRMLGAGGIIGALVIAGWAGIATAGNNTDHREGSTTPVTAEAGVAAPEGRPSEDEVRSAYDEALGCLADSGIVVAEQRLTVTPYDVQVDLAYDNVASTISGAELDHADAKCRANLVALQSAWLNGVEFPTQQINDAVTACLSAKGSTADASGAISSEPGLYGRCMDQARHEVLGTPLAFS